MNKNIRLISVFILLFLILAQIISVYAEPAYDTQDAMPYWFPQNPESFPNFHGSDLKRVVDDADLLTDEEEAALSQKIQKTVDTYNVGFVIFTDNSTHSLSKEVYSADFFLFNGYGVGDDFSGATLFLCMEPGNRGWRTTSFGKCREIFKSEIINKLDDEIEADIKSGNYYNAFDKYVDCFDFIMKHKRFPASAETKAKSLGVGLVIGLIFAAIRISSMKHEMKLHPETAAADYLTGGSLKIRNKRANFLYSTITKTPRDTERSSGGSSYSHGSSSNGTSFSSGGRDF